MSEKNNFDFDNLFKVGMILLIRVSSRNTFVSGSSGELMSTRTRTVRPSRSTSSRVRTFAISPSTGLRFLIRPVETRVP